MHILASVWAFAAAHPTFASLALFFVYNQLVQAMPEPKATSSRAYRRLYRLAHAIAFNIQYALRARFPGYLPPDPPADQATAAGAGAE